MAPAAAARRAAARRLLAAAAGRLPQSASSRWSLGAAALLGVALTVCSAPEPLRIRFIGNAAFELADGRTTLMLDFPYESGTGGFMTYDGASVRPTGRVVAVFTHSHRDHFDRDLLLERGWPVVGPVELTSRLPADRVLAAADTVTVGEFHIVPLAERHADLEHCSYLITWRGRRIYDSGDAMDPTRLESMPELDVALVGEGLLCWMAQQRGARVPAREVMAFHFFTGESRRCLGSRALEQGESIALPPAL